MLSHLCVRNLAIVEQAEADFGPGLNVITGETGAGKSVLMGALDLVLGERADKTLIRDGASEASVDAVFDLDRVHAERIDALLEDAGLPLCESGQLVVRRTLSAASAGRCQINAGTTTAQVLRRIGTGLVDIHGPYDHQSLLAPDFQRDLLDAYGACRAPRAAYTEVWRTLHGIDAELQTLRGNAETFAAELDRMQYVVDEISAAALTEADDEELVARHAETANAGAIVEQGSAVAAALLEGEDTLFDRLVQIRHILAELAHILPDAEAWLTDLDTLSNQTQELARAVIDRLQRIEADPALLQMLEERMALVQKLKRKYGRTVIDILAAHAAAEARLAELASRESRIAQLEADRAAAEHSLTERATEITAARSQAAGKLAKAITKGLRDLGFLKAGFTIDLVPAKPAPHGADEVSFGFAPNPGESPRPLRAIASSGEIARVMLAVKAVLAEHDEIPVLVFDEIDANVGGETGRAVGLKLREVAAAHQVICITHLPQVAVYGSRHLVVAKQVKQNRTTTTIHPLDDEARADEIARMLGGRDLTSMTLDHAREMLRKAQQSGKNPDSPSASE